MAMKLMLLYRGELSSCNYDCDYCPFAKRVDTREQLLLDQQQVARFVDWVAQQSQLDLSIFFTPWGEGLIRPWYQQALIKLSQLSQVSKVAIQTNLSCRLDWLDDCDHDSVGLWCTFHPSEVRRERFLEKCQQLISRNIKFSVGMVGTKENFEQIRCLRDALPEQVYFWINAFKDVADYYKPADVEFLNAIDPLFHLNTHFYPSFDQECHTGDSVISVDGQGTIRRCHFIQQPLGNIYEENWLGILGPSKCTNATCECHIGYVHLKQLDLYSIFADGLAERVPRQFQAVPLV
jgi:MoaA/NifB/PqqE/SkfB family radical SAM enzyme